jgi:hypothetical protein
MLHVELGRKCLFSFTQKRKLAAKFEIFAKVSRNSEIFALGFSRNIIRFGKKTNCLSYNKTILVFIGGGIQSDIHDIQYRTETDTGLNRVES